MPVGRDLGREIWSVQDCFYNKRLRKCQCFGYRCALIWLSFLYPDPKQLSSQKKAIFFTSSTSCKLPKLFFSLLLFSRGKGGKIEREGFVKFRQGKAWVRIHNVTNAVQNTGKCKSHQEWGNRSSNESGSAKNRFPRYTSDLFTRVIPMMPAMKEAQLRLPLSLGTEMNLLTRGS